MSSRARSRFAVVATALPLMLTAAPFVAPALAAEATVSAAHLQPGQLLGPYAGYLGAGIGQNGTTSVFEVTVPSTSSTISSAQVVLTGDSTQISLLSDFDNGDGFALYANHDNQPGFSAADKQHGLKSTGWQALSTESDGDTPIRIDLAGPVSGRTQYFVTAHPAVVNRPVRPFTLRIDPNGIGGSDSGPASTVTTPTGDSRLRIDSQAPGAPARTFFTPNQRAAGTEDSYTVARAANPEAGARVAFYSTASDTVEESILFRPDASRAVDFVLPSSPTATSKEISIGDGTGLNSANPAAKNGQRSNNVYVRLVDPVGNFSPATGLLTNYTTDDTTPRSNTVAGPPKPTKGTLNTINANNYTNASVTARGATNPATTSETSSVATSMKARAIQLAADGTPDLTKVTNWAAGSFSATADVSIGGIDTTAKPGFAGIAEGARAIGETVSLDALGNVSESFISGSVVKDTIRPLVASIETTRAGVAQPGDLVTVRFTEPMSTSKIVNNGTPVGSGAAQRCEPPATQTGDRPKTAVNEALMVTTTSGAQKSWGYNACVQWSADATQLSIRVGDPQPETARPGIECGFGQQAACPPLFSTGDVVTPLGSLGTPEVQDAAGNQALGLNRVGDAVGSTPIGSLTAYPLTATTNDDNKNGYLDSIDVTFTAPVDTAGFADYQPNLSIVGSSTVPVEAVTHPDASNKNLVRFSFGGGLTTGETPAVRLLRPASGPTGMYTAEVTPREVLPFTTDPAADRAAPRPLSVAYLDTTRDGHIDQVGITYSEPIQHTRDNNGTDVTSSGYRVPGYENHPATGADSNTVTPETGSTASKTVTLKPSAAFDTGKLDVTLTFTPYLGTLPSASCATPPCTQIDSTGNAADAGASGGGFTKQVADGAPAAILSRTTRDVDNDGKIDAVDVKFSEFISTPSIGTAVFTVANRQILEQFATAGDTIRLVINEASAPDSDAKPTVTYQGGVSDTQGNVTPADPATPAPTTTDGAGPAIVSACPLSPAPNNGSCPVGDDGTKLQVTFSEPLAQSSVQQADFVVEQPAGTAKAQNAAPAYTAGTKTVTLSFAPNAAPPAAQTAIDETKDAFVRLAADGAVTDTAAPTPNPSRQTSAVTAYALPTVSLSLSCPTQLNDGYCNVTTINTGAAGSSGVSLWRLATTARGTAPAESEFSPAKPSTISLTEGTHTLYLSGKDPYGRLSPEVSATITILKAPKIQNIQLQNSTPRASIAWPKTDTVVDGDNILIGADAVGSDAAQWATTTNNGGCKQANMSIDLRGLTGVATQSAVAPFKCNLLTTTPPYRQMQFPVVKANGTTRYPVGTVIKTSTNAADPGALIVDGPNGTQLRRHFISAGARRSHQISDAQVIRVPTAVLNGIKRGSGIGYRDGAIVKTTGTGYYYMYANVKRPVSAATLSAWKIPTSHAYNLTSGEFKAMGTGGGLGAGAHAVGTWIKFSNGSIQHIVRNAQGVVVRRSLGSTAALSTLVPTTHVYPANSRDAAIPVDAVVKGYRDGTLLKLSGGRYGVVARQSLRVFADPKTFNTLGYNANNARSANGAAMPRIQSQPYRTGAPIERYLLSPSVVITVTNMAGDKVEATVPSSTGLYGVGTHDAVPTGWDFSR